MKIIAFYLPQFHTIPENDLWWGEGFTEWTNVKKSNPLFSNHNQPRIPYEDFYYNLLDAETRNWQAELAKKYGIYGFCYYHYWFKGKRLLEKPFSKVLQTREPDFPFCLCWANEPWTRTWDGGDNQVLMPQDYGNEKDWAEHFDFLIQAFLDERYIRVENKPLFVIYRPSSISRCEEMLNFWNHLARKKGLDGIYFVETLGWFDGANISEFDAYIEFEPMYTLRQYYLNNPTLFNITPTIFDYEKTWEDILSRKHYNKKNKILGAFVDWDNSPRKGTNSVIMDGANPNKFGQYLNKQLKKSKFVYDNEFLFINAWNEWAEGTYLEPDKRYEFHYLEELQNALNQTALIQKDQYILQVKREIGEFLNSGELEKAERYMCIHEELLNKDFDYESMKGVLRFYEGELSQAENIFNNILKRDGKNIDALFNLGIINQIKGNTSKSKEYYEQVFFVSDSKEILEIAKENLAILQNEESIGGDNLNIMHAISSLENVEGWLTNTERLILLNIPLIVDHLKGSIVEIGSFKGKSSLCLAMGSKYMSTKKQKIYCIDPFSNELYGEAYFPSFWANIRSFGLEDFIYPIKAASTNEVALKSCPTQISFLFIDGDHSYSGVKFDIENYSNKVVAGGYIAFHDYFDFYDLNKPGEAGVRQACDELVLSEDFEIIGDYDTLRLIRKIR